VRGQLQVTCVDACREAGRMGFQQQQSYGPIDFLSWTFRGCHACMPVCGHQQTLMYYYECCDCAMLGPSSCVLSCACAGCLEGLQLVKAAGRYTACLCV
jgi:hypothetical protein